MEDEDKVKNKKSFSLDWLVGGVLTKVGDTFDRLTGRGWNPSSSLATSKLIEKLKFLLDSEVRDLAKEGKFVPHIIKLKIQWNKFSTDSEEELEKLEHELHAAAIDHINDKLYHTFAPLNIEIKTDYFTEGVRMLASFGKYSNKDEDEVSINVTIPNLRTEDLISDGKITVNLNGETDVPPPFDEDIYKLTYSVNNKSFETEFNFTKKKRISVGRVKENDLSINDKSISKVHASLVLNSNKQLLVADTGSTNGTFIKGERIAYGKAFSVENGATIKFGNIEVLFERKVNEVFEEFNKSQNDLLPTEAAVNFNKSFAEPKRTEEESTIPPEMEKPLQTELNPTQLEPNFSNNKLNSVLNDLESTNVSARSTKNEIPEEIVTPKSIPNFETENNISSENFESDLSKSPDKTNPDEDARKSKEVNIDKTQDWEV
jgi:pSer/pThr/pTyr-binding forkhead associated (FHA) protein